MTTTTSTDTPARSTSPASTPANPIPAATTATVDPFVSSDTPSSAAPAGDDHPADATIPSRISEPDQAIHVTEEQPAIPQTTEATDERISPEVEGLRAMFPDLDVSILQSVLQSVNGDPERAADVLLGMSDPDYVSQQPPQSQTDLDEEYARRLVQEEQRQQAAWHPDQPYPFAQDPRAGTNVPYQPRVHQGSHQGYQAPWASPPPQSGTGGGTMSEVQEQFSKIAETGKKTFSSLFTKVKAKMSEFDQSRNQSGSAPRPPRQTSWGSGAPSASPPTQSEYAAPTQPPPQGAHSPPPSETVQGYDAAPPSAAGTGLGLSGAAATATSATPPWSAPAPADRIPARPPSAGNVDPSKIGMLPKRPVSLLHNQQTSQSQAQSQTNTNARRDDDDELDYVENPFEEGRK